MVDGETVAIDLDRELVIFQVRRVMEGGNTVSNDVHRELIIFQVGRGTGVPYYGSHRFGSLTDLN